MRRFVLMLIMLIISQLGFGQTKIELPAIFSDHIVLQQKMMVPVWGTAQPGSVIGVQLCGFTTTTKANSDGKWMVRLPEMSAGGPFEMKVWDRDTIRIKDVMIGEVWLASGQSNMAMTVGSTGPGAEKVIADASYANLRFFNVNNVPSSLPLPKMGKSEWKLCNSEVVKNFSAAAYFFGREILLNRKVAVGIVQVSWGATSVEAWMSSEMLKSHPDFTRKVEEFDTDPVKWKAYLQKSIGADRYRDSISKAAKVGVTNGVHLKDFEDKSWKTCQYPLDMAGMQLGGYWGFVWFRKTIEIGKEMKIADFKLDLPVTAGFYEVYMNGQLIKSSENKTSKVPDYILKGKLLNRGKNVLAIRMFQSWATGRIGLKDTEAKLVSLDNKTKISLGGDWRFNSTIEPEVPQWQDYYNKMNVLYNGGIASLIPYGIKGAIWYQGENNAGKAYQYRTLFPMMIEDWRVRWGEGYFPFLFVQLANFRDKQPEPVENDWAELREAQLFTLRYPYTGMAVTTDIGEANDIHPKNKSEVGRRLFLAAQYVAYGEKIVYSGPVYQSMKIDEAKIRISFTCTGTGLQARNDLPLKGFAIAGADKKFVWADAVIDGNEIDVSSSKIINPVAVRYAWEGNPDGNLYNKEGLPASSFRTDQWKGITEN